MNTCTDQHHAEEENEHLYGPAPCWGRKRTPVQTSTMLRKKTNTCTDQHHAEEENEHLCCTGTSTMPHTTEDHKLFKKVCIHASRHIIINTGTADSEEETGKSQMGRGHWVIDICYNCTKLWDWQGCCHALFNQFWVFDITLFVKEGNLLI